MSNNEVSPAVCGIETEYSLLLTMPDDREYEIVGSCHSLDPEARVKLNVMPDVAGGNQLDDESYISSLAQSDLAVDSNGFLSNGARVYLDPSGPAYATPETTTAQEAVLRSFDGDQIVFEVFRNLQKMELIKQFQLNRKIVDHNRTSRGVHLNTLTNLQYRYENPCTRLALATLNIAKGALFGSGGLLLNSEGRTAFHHSPRLSVTTDITASYGNHELRPLFRYPLKDDCNGWARIESVTSDALNFAWPLRASLVITNALVGLIEINASGKLPIASSMIRSAKSVGRYGHKGQMRIYKNDVSKKFSPLDVLRDICETALRIHECVHQLDGESEQVLAEIIEAADKMSVDPYSVSTQVESMARLRYFEKRMDERRISWDSEKLCTLDYAWDWIGGGIAEDLRKNKHVGWHGFEPLASPSAFRQRLITPPQDTRAKVRGRAIKYVNNKAEATWDTLHGKKIGALETELFQFGTIDRRSDK